MYSALIIVLHVINLQPYKTCLLKDVFVASCGRGLIYHPCWLRLAEDFWNRVEHCHIDTLGVWRDFALPFTYFALCLQMVQTTSHYLAASTMPSCLHTPLECLSGTVEFSSLLIHEWQHDNTRLLCAQELESICLYLSLSLTGKVTTYLIESNGSSLPPGFYHASYASAVLAVIMCLSVCLSQVGVVQRWLNLRSD